MRQILVATDFSDISLRALDYAVGFAAAFDARVHLAHVVPLLRYALGHETEAMDPAFELKLKTDLTRRLEELAHSRAAQGRTLETTLADGNPAQAVPELAEKLAADLIVIGTHGHTGFQHLVLGSVAERIVRHSKVPVLTVH